MPSVLTAMFDSHPVQNSRRPVSNRASSPRGSLVPLIRANAFWAEFLQTQRAVDVAHANRGGRISGSRAYIP